MRRFKYVILLALTACIETDIQEPVPEEFRISNSVRDIIFRENQSFVLEAEFFNDSGVAVSVPVLWESSNIDVLTFSGDTATCHQTGLVAITAEARGFTDETIIEVFGEDEEVMTNAERMGMLAGVSGYDITGDFELNTNEEDDLILVVTDYSPDGPGPYFYLSNSASSISNGLNLGEASASGNYEINISDINTDASVNSYDYLIVWCEPFGVRLGFGEFDN